MRLKTWFSLVLAVLLLHLALMQLLPLHLPAAQTPDSVTFTTRALVLTDAPKVAPAQAALRVPDKPRPTPGGSIAAPAVMQPIATVELVDAEHRGIVSPASDTHATVGTERSSTTPPEPVPESLKVLASAAVHAPAETSAARAITNPAFRADALPASVKLVYRVDANKFPFRLSSELLWQQHDHSYAARLSISAFGQSRVQTSRGQVDQLGLAPERFSDKSRSEVAAHFNHAQGMVSFSANTPSVPLQPGAQDRLSVLIQLATLVASAPQRFTPGTTLSVQTVGPREADLWLFTFGDMEVLDLPGGAQQGLKLIRQPRQTYDQKLEVWLAPGIAYLPARIRITEANGDYVDQKWAASESADSP